MSVSSDLFTIGRTLAVLAFNFDFAGEYRYRLPNPTDVPLLAEQDSFHRLLCRATDADPGRRFSSAAEMVEQVTGVLREVLAAEDGRPRPALSRAASHTPVAKRNELLDERIYKQRAGVLDRTRATTAS